MNQRFIGIAVFSIVITAVAMVAIFYMRLKVQVFSDLEIIALLLTENVSEEKIPAGIRVTVINADGTVTFDSAADVKRMENHLDRPEVQAALLNGEGKHVRRSDTLAKSTFYYAMQTEEGRILRVGKEAISVVWVLLSAFPVMFWMMLLLFAVCLAASHYLTAEIVRPIDEMVEDMEHIEEKEIYEEFIPFTRKIRSQHEEILSAANMRQEFTANVSHELKTPLAAISGYAELMETGVARETDIRHFSQEIHKSADRLLNLINDILKLSRLDAQEGCELLEVVDLAAVAADTVEMLSINAAKANVRLKYEGCVSAKIRIGKELADEITYNLIENAIRYNKRGGEVFVSVEADAENVRFLVKDTGIGIGEEHQKRIFERFYRVDKSRSKELGGTGLGLAIVKHICDLTGGKLSLESKEGEGTSITVLWGNS